MALALLLAGCGERAAPRDAGAGMRLERAARAAGLVAVAADPTGVYASESDRLCVAPGRGARRIGVAVGYDAGNGCTATGTLRGRRVTLGDGCAFDATVAADRVTFPAIVPTACDRRCIGRASLAALDAARLSGSAAEAAAFRLGDRTPCA